MRCTCTLGYVPWALTRTVSIYILVSGGGTVSLGSPSPRGEGRCIATANIKHQLEANMDNEQDSDLLMWHGASTKQHRWLNFENFSFHHPFLTGKCGMPFFELRLPLSCPRLPKCSHCGKFTSSTLRLAHGRYGNQRMETSDKS